MRARLMRGDFFEFDPTHKLVVVGNHRPVLRNVDGAMRRRLLLVPFTAEIPDHMKDKQLTEKLRAEYPETVCVPGAVWDRLLRHSNQPFHRSAQVPSRESHPWHMVQSPIPAGERGTVSPFSR